MTWPLLNKWLIERNLHFYYSTLISVSQSELSVCTQINNNRSKWLHMALQSDVSFLTIRIDTRSLWLQWLLFSYVLLLFLFSWAPLMDPLVSFPQEDLETFILGKRWIFQLSFGFIRYFKECALTNPYIGNRDLHQWFLTLNCIPKQWKHIFHLTSYCVLMGLALKHLKLVILLSRAEWRGGS